MHANPSISAPSLPIDPDLFARSRAYCQQLTKAAAKNFYYGLKLLPEPKRSAMYALYAYMRLVDDIADDDAHRSPDQRLNDLEQWRQYTHSAQRGDPSKSHIVWPAFADLVTRFRIPPQLFDDMIEGQRQDMTPCVIHTFADLHAYCYRVASVVGLASIRVWGVKNADFNSVQQLGIDRGIAFQLTNVLRDLKEDSARGRCYLPQEDLQKFAVSPQDIASGKSSPAFDALMRFQITRAQSFYTSSSPLENQILPDSKPTLQAMTEIYHGLLRKIAQRPSRVLHERVRLSTFAKLRIGWHAMKSR